ncbi:MAG TPA: hypothetical protein VFF15_08445 [Flavobacteriaceae bacterium]|nr:hypothetical protein [Flavobacteriaceae bacterium]
MKKKIGILLAFSALLPACQNATQEKQDQTQAETGTYRLAPEAIKALSYTDYVLDAKATQTLSGWQKFTELENHIKTFRQADFSFLNDNHEVLTAFLKSLQETLPEKINTPAVAARLKVLENAFLKLEDQLMRANAKENELLTAVKEVLNAYANVKLQINKKFEKEAQQITK